jgi:hypothetical protein
MFQHQTVKIVCIDIYNCRNLLAPSFNKIYYSHFYVSVTQDEFRLVNEGGALPIGASFLSALDLTRYNTRNVTTNMLRPKQCSTLYYC